MLFVGHDASTPQIAASLLIRLAGDRVAVRTAGAELADPGGRSDEMLVAMGLNSADEQRLSARALRTVPTTPPKRAGLERLRMRLGLTGPR